MGSSIETPDGNIYACNYEEAEEIINRHAGITAALDEKSYALYKALNYSANNCVPQFRENSDRFCFVIDVCGYPRVDSGIGAIATFNENNVRLCFSYNANNINALNYSLLSSGACEEAVIGGGRYNFEDFIIKEIFGEHENEYPIISAVGWKRINLDEPITEEYFTRSIAIDNDPSLRDGIINLNKYADTDKDGLLDLEEIMFRNEDGKDLISFDSNGNTVLPNFEDCTGALPQNRKLFYVKNGLLRYADVAKFQDLYKLRILPIKSDPTNKDSDGDGKHDSKDGKPLSEIVILSQLVYNNTGVNDSNKDNIESIQLDANSKVNFEYEQKMVVDFGWFYNNPNEYNNELALSSTIMAGLAYHTTAVEDGAISDRVSNFANEYCYAVKNHIGDNPKILTNVLDEYDFENCYTINLRNCKDDNGNYYNDNHYIQFDIGHRNISEYAPTNSTNKNNLLAIFVRGTHGTEEWYSNFDIGDTDEWQEGTDWNTKANHMGFDMAATRAKKEIVKYLNTYGLNKENTVIWLAGHYRGAAVSGIIATYLISDGYTVYGYNFATPNQVEVADSSEVEYVECSGIFNIINADDLVPCLSLEDWNFAKYGEIKMHNGLNNQQRKIWSVKGIHSELLDFDIGATYDDSPFFLNTTLKSFYQVSYSRNECYHIDMTDERYLLYINVDSDDFFDYFPEWKKYYGDYYRNGPDKYVRQKPILFMQMLAGLASGDMRFSTLKKIKFIFGDYTINLFDSAAWNMGCFSIKSGMMNPHYVDSYIILCE